jgi:hypothetical protein
MCSAFFKKFITRIGAHVEQKETALLDVAGFLA